MQIDPGFGVIGVENDSLISCGVMHPRQIGNVSEDACSGDEIEDLRASLIERGVDLGISRDLRASRNTVRMVLRSGSGKLCDGRRNLARPFRNAFDLHRGAAIWVVGAPSVLLILGKSGSRRIALRAWIIMQT